MKFFQTVACTALVLVSALFSVPAQAATDPTGIFTLRGPGNLDLGENLIMQFNSSGAQGRGLPSVVTNTAAVLATNVIVPIIQDSELAIQFNFGTVPTNSAATSNVVFRFVASADNGRSYTTQPWFTLSIAQQGSNIPINVIHLIGHTNLAVLTHLKLYNISNTMTVGAGPVYPTNIVFTQKRRNIRVN